jgi:hypothetical protein
MGVAVPLCPARQGLLWGKGFRRPALLPLSRKRPNQLTFIGVLPSFPQSSSVFPDAGCGDPPRCPWPQQASEFLLEVARRSGASLTH